MKSHALILLVITVLPALSVPWSGGLSGGKNGAQVAPEPLELPSPPKAVQKPGYEPEGVDPHSPKAGKLSHSLTEPPHTTTETTASETETTTKEPWITMPLQPALDVPFYVPTLFAPHPTSTTHATSTTLITGAVPATAAPTAQRRGGMYAQPALKPGNARALPSPTLAPCDDSAQPALTRVAPITLGP